MKHHLRGERNGGSGWEGREGTWGGGRRGAASSPPQTVVFPLRGTPPHSPSLSLSPSPSLSSSTRRTPLRSSPRRAIRTVRRREQKSPPQPPPHPQQQQQQADQYHHHPRLNPYNDPRADGGGGMRSGYDGGYDGSNDGGGQGGGGSGDGGGVRRGRNVQRRAASPVRGYARGVAEEEGGGHYCRGGGAYCEASPEGGETMIGDGRYLEFL